MYKLALNRETVQMGSSLSGLAFPCILGAIIGLVVLNFRHSLRCENAVEHDVTEEFIEALQRRLELAESEVTKHTVYLRLTIPQSQPPFFH